jgi:hypothetical protein
MFIAAVNENDSGIFVYMSSVRVRCTPYNASPTWDMLSVRGGSIYTDLGESNFVISR